jgi:Fur family transcriptional regulator, ferric uptake regulator
MGATNLRRTAVEESLRSVGLKATTQRLAVMQILDANEDRYLSADEVHLIAAHRSTNIARATVYRVLSQLTDVGLLVRKMLHANSSVAFYKLESHARDTLLCLICQRVVEFSDDVFRSHALDVAVSKGFTLRRHQLTLQGHCPTCQASSSSATK